MIRTPLHTHTTDEVVVIDAGAGEYRLGEDRRAVGPGTVVFIPARQPHGVRNVGAMRLDLHALFASARLDITYLERNPAPGTEGDPPQPPLSFDPREDAGA